MIEPRQFRRLVVRPVLEHLGLWSLAAERLLIGTALVESRLIYLEQLPAGPALGVFQMEPGTNLDIWQHYLAFRPARAAKVWAFAGGVLAREREMIGNLNYATAMARIHYLRVPHPLPDAEDFDGLGAYWKNYYNTVAGKGSVERWRAEVWPHWQTSAFRDHPWVAK